MAGVLTDDIARFVRATTPTPDAVLEEMEADALERGFPYVGPEVGAALRLCARMVNATRVFEFGSGYGYSAYWFAGSLSVGDELVLTEVDRDELDRAREYMARGDFDAEIHYEHGDALEIFDVYDGPFDVVLLDHENHRYPEAFDMVRDELSSGGVVVADNVVSAGNVDFGSVLATVEGDDPGPLDENTRGIAEYLDVVQSAPDFETSVLPLGEGLAVSVHVG